MAGLYHLTCKHPCDYDDALLFRKFASQNRANKEQHRDEQAKHEIETGDAGIFSLINSRLGDQSRQRHMHGSTHHAIEQQTSTPRQSKFSDGASVQATPKPQDRKSLIAHQVLVSLIWLNTRQQAQESIVKHWISK